MEKPIYNIESTPDGLYHVFESTGVGITVKKLVVYLPDEQKPDLFHLIFGDLKDHNKLDVFAVSDNQDMKIILSTVIQTLFGFFEQNPTKRVFFTGSTDARTRLYRATIAKVLDKSMPFYHISGLLDDDSTEIFNPSKTYRGYFIEKKYEEEN